MPNATVFFLFCSVLCACVYVHFFSAVLQTHQETEAEVEARKQTQIQLDQELEKHAQTAESLEALQTLHGECSFVCSSE
jgi:Ca2+/H+ antiporter